MMHSSSEEDTNTAQHRAEQARHILQTLPETKPPQKKEMCIRNSKAAARCVSLFYSLVWLIRLMSAEAQI